MFVRFGVLLILGVTARLALSSYDVGRMSPVGNVSPKAGARTRCSPYAAFALTAALEVAYHKATGRRRIFSVQEIVDCYHRQCSTSRMDNLVNWLIVNDRLATKDKYTEYRGKAFTCRAGTSPDGLTNIKVTGLRKIAPDNFEEEIRRNGVVLSCLDTSKGGCPDYNDKYRGGVIAGNSSRTQQYCVEQVLIVGFDEDTYRVRASKGEGWGERGYFKIARGGNTCGIEQSMSVLETETRRSKPTVNARTGCPLEFPKYCSRTRTCRANNQRCASEIKQQASQSSSHRPRPSGGSYRPSGGSSGRPSGGSSGGYRPSGGSSGGYQFGNIRSKRYQDAEDHSEHEHGLCDDHPDYPCANMKAHCRTQRIRERCGATCEVCNADGTPKCQDTETRPGECATFAKYCATIPGIRVKCALTCHADPIDCEESSRPEIEYAGDIKEPPKGMCSPPTVANGQVLNRGLMRPGDQLRITCDSGFTLTGEASTCEIQNVFAPDTRRIQECVRLGSEDFEGNGANYAGSLNMVVTNKVCGNWLELAHKGLFRGLDRGLTLLQGGNHNFCRNIGGEDFTPFCYTSSGQLKEYCFELPRCGGTENDKCSAVRTDFYDDCSEKYDEWSCELMDERAIDHTMWYWEKCAAMCCSYAGCQ